MKHYLFFTILALAPLFAQEFSPATAAVQKLPPRALSIPYASLDEAQKANPWESSWCQKLSGNWKFFHSTDPAAKQADFVANNFDDKEWKEIPVPSNWQLQDFGGLTALSPKATSRTVKSIGRYRHEFTLPDSWKSRKTVLHFGGVDSACSVWVNGKKAGFAEDACTAAEFDISALLQEGKNILAVEVYQFSGHTNDAALESFQVSGIYRDVYLLSYDPIALVDMQIKAGLTTDFTNGLFECTASVKNSSAADAEVTAKINLTDDQNRSVASPAATVKIPAGQSAAMSLKSDPLAQVKLWTAETPNLYRATLTLQDASGKVLALHRFDVGFHRSEFVDGNFLYNGKTIELKGVKRNEFHMSRGHALTEEDIRKELLTLKTANFNAIWNDNRPSDEAFLRLCDSLGFHVIEGANDVDLPGNSAELKKQRLQNLVLCDRNHASVIAWASDDDGMADFVRQLDDTRPLLGKSFDRKSFATMKDIAVRRSEVLADQTEAPAPDIKLPDGSSAPKPQTGEAAKPRTRSYMVFGAALDPQITDGDFGAKGILNASGIAKPVFEEWKKRNQEIQTKIRDVNGSPLSVVIRNKRFFRPLNDVKGSWKLMKNGLPVASGDLNVLTLAAQQEMVVDVALTEKKDPQAEYFFRVRYDLIEANAWHPAGMPIAWEEIPLPWGKLIPLTLVEPLKEAGFAENDSQVELKAEEAAAVIDKKSGMLVSWKMKNQDMLLAPLALNFWRANSPTRSEAQRVWQKAGREAKVTSIQAGKENKNIVVKVALALAAGQSTANVTYRWNSLGKISIETEFHPDAAMPDIPVIGYQTRTMQTLANARWYGKGPGETYPDRETSAWTTIHQGLAPQMFFRHPKPRESSNRSGIRWMELTNITGGWSLRADTADEQSLNFSAYPCGVDELDQAKSQAEIPKLNFQEVQINHKQSAVDVDQVSARLSAKSMYHWAFILSSQNLPPTMPAKTPGVMPPTKTPGK